MEIIAPPPEPTPRQTVLHILSGGLDSTVALYLLKEKYHVIGCISFNYGQKHSKELEYAKKTCDLLSIPHTVVDLTSLTHLLASSLTRADQAIPEGHYAEENMKQTVVPNRNMIMMSIAAGYAITLKANAISLGVHKGDHAIYPDCRAAFMNKMAQAFKMCDWHQLKLLTPVLYMDKTKIVTEGIKLKVPFENTWTCYKGEERPCGKCGSCSERNEAFTLNNYPDPL